jgi:hypothetical protein
MGVTGITPLVVCQFSIDGYWDWGKGRRTIVNREKLSLKINLTEY